MASQHHFLVTYDDTLGWFWNTEDESIHYPQGTVFDTDAHTWSHTGKLFETDELLYAKDEELSTNLSTSLSIMNQTRQQDGMNDG